MSDLSQTGGHSATLIKNSISIYFYLFYFQLIIQNKKKADWVAKQVTEPQNNIYKRT